MRLKDTFIIICQTFIEACNLEYCARSFFNKYMSVCHPSDRDINWRPASLYGNCIGMHKLLPFSKFMRFPTLFYNV